MFALLAACYFILEALQETQFLGINHNGWHRSFLSYTTTTIIIVCLMMLMISSFIIHYIRLFPQIGPRWKRLKHKLMFCYGINCQRRCVIINLLTFYWTLTGASAFLSYTHTWASLQSWEGYPPPEFFLISTPPPQEGLSWAKYSPPRKNFWANYLKISPPRKNILENFRKILEFWCRVVKDIPPLRSKNLSPSKNFSKKFSPPSKFSKSLPPHGVGCLPTYGRLCREMFFVNIMKGVACKSCHGPK